ncbi:MAG: extracellular solute-binding protein [Chloroflexi bacterium]|nr:extracellular solute-binding protein [Chloroflexota bacterium]
MRTIITVIALLMVASIVAACAPGAVPQNTPSGAPEARPAAAGQPAGKEAWQIQWERLLSEAKKERRLVLYSSSGSAVREPITQLFSEKFGLDLEWVSATTAQLEERIYRERRAGIYEADIYFSGSSGVQLAEVKALQPIDNILFLPEVLDKSAWWGGGLIFDDDEHTWAGILAYPVAPVFYNVNLVDPNDIKSYKDFLKPKWKKQIVLFNPRTGGGLSWVYNVSVVLGSVDYLRDLAKQEPIIVNDARQQVEWVAFGKYPVALGGRGENKAEFVRMGAPVKMAGAVEGDYLVSGAGGVGVFDRAPHPNAAKLFANWALSREGATLVSKVIGGQSARLDVPTDFLDPIMVRQPGVKYFNTITKEHTQKKDAFGAVALEIFGPLMK